MRRALDGVAPAPLPAGVTIRLVRPDDDEDLRLFHRIYDTGFRDAYDYQPRDYDTWRAYVAGLTSVAWDEWFVAEVDGVPAGVLMSADQLLEQQRGLGQEPGGAARVPQARRRRRAAAARVHRLRRQGAAPTPASAST